MDNLKLRKQDLTSLLTKNHETIKTFKRENIRDIVIQNFRRQFRIEQSSDKLDKMLTEELNAFFASNKQISAKDLSQF